MKLSDYVFKIIADIGVKDIFLLPGGGCMHLVDSLGRRKDLNYICCLHEQAAAIAAEAYGQYTNNIGVALVTTGPGGTNAITGVTGAWIDSTPLLIFSGQVKRADMMGNKGVRQMGVQEVDIIALVKPITKYAVSITEPLTIAYHLEKALYLAQHGRKGPVWIDIPLDIQNATIDINKLTHFEKFEKLEGYNSNVLDEKIRKTIELLESSERPVILAGNGIRLAKAQKDFDELVALLQIPVLLTWKASDLMYEDHPLYCGKPGSVGQRGANFAQQNSDFILTLGARLDLCQVAFNYSKFAPSAKKVIVEIDKNEIDKLEMIIDVPVHADVAQFLKELLNQVRNIKLKQYNKWLVRCHDWKLKYPVILPEYLESKGLINTYALIKTLSNILNESDIIVPGSSGGCAEITQQSFKLKKGQRILNTPGLGAMGFGLPACIGACLASGKRRTISIIGDGGLQHNIQELETLRRLQLPIKIFILNNNGYGSIRNTQKTYFEGHLVACDPSSGLTFPDIYKISEAYGLKTFRIENQTYLEEKICEVINEKGSVLCEVMVDPDVPTAPRVSTQILPDGKIISKSMEDLWPFLERNEFYSNIM